MISLKAKRSEDMLAAAREVGFRAALHGANPQNLTDLQIVHAIEQNSITVYQSHYTYLACALSVSLLSILSVAPIFWGWRRLGREVTLSPIEIAKAFDPAVLSSTYSNSTVKNLLKEIGDKRVRYGALDVPKSPYGEASSDQNVSQKIAISELGSVTRPNEGSLFAG
jgi:hypothetical protein